MNSTDFFTSRTSDHLPYPTSTRSRRSPRLRTTFSVEASPPPPSTLKRPFSREMKHTYQLLRPRSPAQLAKYVIGFAALGVFCFWWLWELHVEIAVYSRGWVQQEILTTDSLAGCFDPLRISPKYNITRAFGPKKTEVQAGLPLRLGMDCYDFAGTIAAPQRQGGHAVDQPVVRVNYHTYWRVDLAPFTERQEWTLKSFFATQDLSTSRLILWSNGDLKQNQYIQKWLRRYPEAFDVNVVNIEDLAKGTALEGSSLLHSKDQKAWVDGDLIRLLLIWNFGGIWIDMDSLMTRDLSPLFEHEFMTQWDCYDKIYQPFNGAVMHFFQHSPYLCEAFELMARSPAPHSGTTEWGSLLYLKLWRRLVGGSIPPFKILPFCFTDARSCRLDNRLPDPFVEDKGWWATGFDMQEGGVLDDVLSKVFSVHLHNQWEKNFPENGWVQRLLLSRFDRTLAVKGSDEDI